MHRKDLAQKLAGKGPKVGAEIGVWRGKFSAWLCRANPDLDLFCVDPWSVQPDYPSARNTKETLDYIYKHAKRNLAGLRCTFMRKPSVDAAPEVADASLDFVYIDANHTYEAVTNDLEAWVPKVKVGGIVAGHDYFTCAKNQNGVEQAVNEYVDKHGITDWSVIQAGKDEPSFLWVKA